MASTTPKPESVPTVYLFGPQLLSFTAASLAELRTQCHELPGLLEWVLQILAELPGHWENIQQSFPSLAHLESKQELQYLAECLRTGDASNISFPLPNRLLCPFVIILHLTQYLRYCLLANEAHNVLLSNATAEAAGFCTGLLSALAVSCSATREQLEHHGAIAIRVALLIGAVVDMQNQGREFTSFSAAWPSRRIKHEMLQILKAYPEVYISVTYDDNRSTVTAPKDLNKILLQKLKEIGVSATELNLQGRFHDPQRKTSIQDLVDFCNSRKSFSLPDARHLILPTRSQNGSYIASGSLHEIGIKAILVDHCHWHQTFASIRLGLTEDQQSMVSFGLERCVPQSFTRGIGQRLIHMADIDAGKMKLKPRATKLQDPNHDRIAVIGMSCRVPGANDLEDFWSLLCENKSQHVEVPGDRFSFETPWRSLDPNRKWFGNFVEDIHSFDHKFFNKSPREASAMDPQQKMILQAAYQAVQQSGYFQSSRSIGKHIGCYIGVSNVDYQDNAACHAVTAFTATGSLMSFVAGKIGHFFGWTGPAMSIDTACSGSSVAIHEACKAVLSGECTAALAGGVNAMTSPLWFQNLAGASFLSPTGQCKPFDAKGDGYCRSEAVGAVFLKRLSTAIADGDQILGTIAATAVHQNQNCTAITVPNSPSLSNLFEEVIQSAKLAPDAITFVEAHGTGTAVGDPAEYGGIRQALGGQKRSGTLALRSVKGLVGHAECASGIVALIKTLLQIQKGIITPQASHSTINPALHASSSDKIEISTHSIPWDSPFKAALINNYGASGSNASMVVTEAPPKRNAGMRDAIPDLPQPFWVSGTDDQSLHRYISKLLSLLASSTDSISLPNLAFSNTLQSNRSLGRALIFQASTIEAFKETLQSFQRNELAANEVNKQSRPVILCFGGQVSTFVGLDRHVFEHTAILRKHLDQCNLICKSMGLPGIYPDIFEREPIEDAVQFQTALFSMQYSCAKSWIDCGLQVVAVVGHSFGELVAQTVAGAMTLTDGLKVVARRACLVRDSWGSDKGSMMAVEGDLQLVEDLLARANLDESVCKYPASIACYNGPTSFTLAGSTESINRVESFLREEDSFKASIRYKRLNTSHAFHSSLVEDLTASLEQITHDIAFSSPHIPVERATKIKNTVPLSSSYIAEHLREPVYFNDAVTRLADKYKDAVWVEAGSQSTVTKMAAKALGRPLSSHFQAINLTSDGAWQRLIDDTIVLWKQGLKVDFWPHHPSQAPQYTPLILPPYQFEKVSNFIELKVQKPGANASSDESLNDKPLGLWTFMEYRDTNQKTARFRVETTHKKFQELLTGHKVANSQPLCSSTIQLEIATEAIRSLCPDFQMSDFQLDLRNLENQTPICQDDSRVVWLDVATTDDSRRKWSWKIVSNPLGGTPGIGESLHATGKVIFHRRDDAEFMDEYKRFARLVTHQRCCEVLEGQEGDDILQGSFIYKLFSDVVDYSEVFRGVRKVVGSAKGSTSAGRVVKKYSDETWLDAPLCDSFCQVAGIYVNCMTQRPDSDAFISSGVQRIVRSPFIKSFEQKPEVFDVFALHHKPTEKSFSSDVFVFDSKTSQLLGVILGIQYQRVSKIAMSKLLTRLTPGARQPHLTVETSNIPKTESNMSTVEPGQLRTAESVVIQSKPQSGPGVASKVVAVISEMVGVDADKVTDDTNLADLGIDSLMGMELSRELESIFKCTLDMASMLQLTDVKDLFKWIRTAIGEADIKPEPPKDDLLEQSIEMERASSLTTSSPINSAGESDILSETPPSGTMSPVLKSATSARQAAIDLYVAKYSSEFSMTSLGLKSIARSSSPSLTQHVVLVTGATGSLGAHLVEHFARLSSVGTVVCFNRPSSRMEPMARMRQALIEKGICLDDNAFAKLQVIASDTSKPLLGLDQKAYQSLVSTVTHVVHCAWPMSITRSIFEFEKQFIAMRNLIDLGRDVAHTLPSGVKVGFQFISSIATVGMYPVITQNSIVTEDVSNAKYALPSGYSDAKLVCERLVNETLNRYPERFNGMSVRVGQISGSKTSGYWNPVEHFSLMIKSAHNLKTFPNLQGHLSWLPANDVAATLADLALCVSPSSNIYHVENPVRQSWPEAVSILADELGIPSSSIIPFNEWLDRVRFFSSVHDTNNPAKKVITFLEKDFQRMACGGLVLGTDKAVQDSSTLRQAKPIEDVLIRKYIRIWKDKGIL